MNDRVYVGEDGLWYYRARGNNSVGPFLTRVEAEKTLAKRIRTWAGRANPKASWPDELKPSRIFRRSATRHP